MSVAVFIIALTHKIFDVRSRYGKIRIKSRKPRLSRFCLSTVSIHGVRDWCVHTSCAMDVAYFQSAHAVSMNHRRVCLQLSWTSAWPSMRPHRSNAQRAHTDCSVSSCSASMS